MDLLNKSNMDNHRLLASAALFRGMYSEKLDQYDVLAEFVKATVTLHNLHTFDVSVCASFLKQDFGFEIPAAVIRNCIKAKLQQQFQRVPGTPDWTRLEGFIPSPALEQRFAEFRQAQEGLSFQLVKHVETKIGHTLSDDERVELIDDFSANLKGSPRQNANFPFIGHFILSIETNSVEKEILENTRQGLIMFDGLRYSAEHLGANLPSNLTIYIDTEVLFNAAGYHGDLRRQLFLDFFSLVTEINDKAKKKDSGKIYLRYFDETAREVQNYFDVAIAIAEKRTRPEPHKQAMRHIVNGCANGADVIAKRVKFFSQLEKYKIRKDEVRNYYDPPDYNIESEAVLAALAVELGCEQEKAAHILKQFSRINFLRHGESKQYLEVSGFILLSERNLTRSAAFSKTVISLNDKTVPFATDLDYITERLWFKLNKGFSSSQPVPATFDVIARTKIVLSSQLGSKVAREYQCLIEQHEKAGSDMTEELLAKFVHDLMDKLRQPEEVTNDSLDLAFLTDDDFVSHAVAQYSALTLAAEEGQGFKKDNAELQSKIAGMELIQERMTKAQEWRDARYRRREMNRPYLRRATYACLAARVLYWPTLLIPVCALIYTLKNSNDTSLALFGTYFTVIPVVFGLVLHLFRKKFDYHISKMRKSYLRTRFSRVARKSESPSSAMTVPSQSGI